MTKGTFTAGQALRPTELKVADYYGKYIDDMIKRGDAEKAAKAKALQEQRNRIGERFKDIKIDPYATIANLQDFANQQMVETAKYIGEQRMLAENDLANSHIYMQRAENAWNDYRTMSSSFGNKDFIEKANAKQQALANNDVFGDTDNNERLRMLGNIIPNVKRNEDGRITFYMPKNANATDDDELQAYSAGQIISHWTTPDEINMLRSNKSNGNNGFLDKQAFDVAKVMVDEYDNNYDGNITNARKWFSEARGSQWFDSTFGEYNSNNIPVVVRQYSKEVLKKEIESPEDFAAARTGIINHIASLVPESKKRDTKYTAAQLQGQILANQQKILDIQKGQVERAMGYPSLRGGSSSSSGGGAGGFMDMNPVLTNENSKVQIRDAKGNVTGTQTWNVNSVALPKVKGMPATENSFGVASFKNKKGQQVDTWLMGAPAEDGKMVFGKISEKDFNEYVRRAGYNPIAVKSNLTKKQRYLNRYTGNLEEGSSESIYAKTKISFKSKEISED